MEGHIRRRKGVGQLGCVSYMYYTCTFLELKGNTHQVEVQVLTW